MVISLQRYTYAFFCSIIASIVLTGCATRAPYLKLEGIAQKDVGRFGGFDYVPLAHVCDLYKLQWSWDPFSGTAIVKGMDKRISIREGSPVILVNGVQGSLVAPPLLHNGALYVPVPSVLGLLTPVPAVKTPGTEAPVAEKGLFTINTIVLDPGHGGEDAGARSRRFGVREKDVTLAIAKRLRKILEERGVRVILTRESDRFLPLPKRAALANESGTDLFVSIHVNSSRTRRGSGVECYYLSDSVDDNARASEAAAHGPLDLEGSSFAKRSRALTTTLWDMVLTENRRESRELARALCDAAEANLSIKNRGVKSAKFYVLENTRIPAVLVEVGFLTNTLEARRMREAGYLERVSKALADGIFSYRSEFERTKGFTS